MTTHRSSGSPIARCSPTSPRAAGSTSACCPPRHNHRTRRGAGLESTHNEWPHFGDALEIAVDVYYTQPMMKRGLCNQQIGYGCAVPHPVVMCQIPLQLKGPVENVGRCADNVQVGVRI